jgi:hypothetical protein
LLQAVRLVSLSSELVTTQWNQRVGLLWLDGDHSYEGVNRDFACWSPHLGSTAVVALDDSLDPGLGPARLIDELVRGRAFIEQTRVGKVTVLAANPRRQEDP